MKRIPRVAITGIGPISPMGTGRKEFWKGLLSKKSTVREIECKIDNKHWTTFLKHKIEDFNINDFGIDDQLLKSIKEWKEGQGDDDLFFMLAATKLALNDSRLNYVKNDSRIGLVVTHENPGLEQYFSQILEVSYKYFQLQKELDCKVDFYNYMFKRMLKSSFELQTFMPVFHIAKTFGLHGYSLFINNACASGAFALEEAKRIIQSGQCQAVVVVSADFPNMYKYLWFKELGMYSKSGIMKPFCKDADGFILGDGAVALVLENMESVNNRASHVYAEYLGGSFSQEAWKVTLPSVSEKYYKNTISGALNSFNIKPADIDLIVPHGVSTPLSDNYESKALKEVFGEFNNKQNMMALKTYFGHNLGGNVLLEIAAILMMLENECILPTLNVDEGNLITRLPISKSLIRKKISLALKTTCAFAGFDSAIIIKKVS